MIGRLLISKEFYKRNSFEKKQLMKISKAIIRFDPIIPFSLFFNKNNQGKKNSKSIFHARCRISGRNKANFNKFKMSRMIFKKNGENGNINGIKKASW